MDVRNVDSRLQHLGYGPQLPPGPDWSGAVRNRQAAPVETSPQGKAPPDPDTVLPNAAPAERQIVLSQQSISDALRELKLPETPQNVMIAQSLTQMDQPVTAQNMTMVREALRGLPAANADDVAAAVILLMNDLPVTPAGVASVRQLMNGPALPDQLNRLGNQLNRLMGQLDQAGQTLATIGSQPGAGQTMLSGQAPVAGQIPGQPQPGVVPGMPLNVLPPGAQAAMTAQAAAAAANAQAAAAIAQTAADDLTDGLERLGEGVAAAEEGASETGEAEGASPTGKGGQAGAAGGTASLTGTGNRRENAPISRALSGAIGRMTSDQSEGVGQLPNADLPPLADAPSETAGRGRTDERQDGSQGGRGSSRGGQASSDVDNVAHAETGSEAEATDGDLPGVRLDELAAKSANTAPKLNLATNRPAMPDAPLPPGLNPATDGNPAGSGTPPRPDQPGSSTTANSGQINVSGSGNGQPTASGNVDAGQVPKGTTGNSSPATGNVPTANTGVPGAKLNVGAGVDATPAQTPMGTATAGSEAAAPLPNANAAGVTAKLAPAVQLLRSAELTTTVREPAHLAQQVTAMKDVFRDLPAALLNVEKELREFAADPRPVSEIPLPELETLLTKAIGKHVGMVQDAHDEGILRQLFDDLRKAFVSTSGSLHETLGHLNAREQLSQSSNVMCLPLALPGPPPRPVELLVEADPDEEHHRRQGGIPTQMRLSIDTHHLGRVGIDLTSWQEKLSIKLQVANPKVQHLIAEKLEQLDKALARNGFVTPDLSVAVAPAAQRASMLLPERKYTRSLRRIEGII